MIELLGTVHPIIQAPMAGVSTPALAAAVSNAGGLGSLGIGASSVAQARSAILQTQSLTDQPFNANVFCNAPPRRDKNIETAWIKHFSALFDKFSAKAPESLHEIYQTFFIDDEAFRMLLEVRPAFVSFHFGIPTAEKIAAFRAAGPEQQVSGRRTGGIMNGLGIKAALDLGAVAAQLGTAFILCPESSAD